MSYKVKYRSTYLTETGGVCTVDILELGYLGEINFVNAIDEPELSWGGSDGKESGIVSLKCTLTYLSRTTFNADTLFSENPRNFKVILYSGSTVEFVGWLQGDLAKDVHAHHSEGRLFSVTATDGLSDLSDIDIKDTDGAILKDRISVTYALQKALEMTGLNLRFMTAVHFFDSYMSQEANMLNQVTIDPLIWVDEEKTISAWEVLESLCTLFYARLFQRNGDWCFVCIDNQISSTIPAYFYTWQGQQVLDMLQFYHGHTVNTNPVGKTQNQLNSLSVSVGEKLSKENQRPIKRLEVHYEFGQAKSEINGDFFGGSPAGWVFRGGISYALQPTNNGIGAYQLRINGRTTLDPNSSGVPEYFSVADHLTTSEAFSYDEKFAATYCEVKKGEKVELSFDYFAPSHRIIKIAVVFTYKNYKGTEKTTANIYDDLSTIDYSGLGSDGKWYSAEKVKGGKIIRHLAIDNLVDDINGNKIINTKENKYSISSQDAVPADGWVKVYFYRGGNAASDSDTAGYFVKNIELNKSESEGVSNLVVVIDNPNVTFGNQKKSISIKYGEPINRLNYSFLAKLNGGKTNESWNRSGITPPTALQALTGAMYLRQHSGYCLVLEGSIRGYGLSMGDTVSLTGYPNRVFLLTDLRVQKKSNINTVRLVEMISSSFEPTYYLKVSAKLNRFFGTFASVVIGAIKAPNNSNKRQGADDIVGDKVNPQAGLTDVYKNWFETLPANFDVNDLVIGSHRIDVASWANITNAPTSLPSRGHFLVFEADNNKVIQYVADTPATANCNTTRCAEKVIVENVAQDWNYYAQAENTDQYGEIAVPSAYDKGAAKDVALKVFSSDFLKRYATLSRGIRIGAIDFNKTTAPGSYLIDNAAGFSANGSTNAPSTDESTGILEVTNVNCNVIQRYYPDGANRTGLYFREKTKVGNWTTWYKATEGNMLTGDIVKVPTFYRRGVGSGMQSVEVYSAKAVNQLANYTPGAGISIVDRVISWTGSGNISETDPTVPANVKAITTGNISNWNAAFGWGNHAGLYFTKSESDARYALLNHVHAISEVSGLQAALDAKANALHTHTISQVTGLQTALDSKEPTIASGTAAQYIRGNKTLGTFATDARTAISVDGGVLSYNPTTGVVGLSSNAFLTSFTETDPTVPANVKAITTEDIANWNAAFGWGNHAAMGYLTSLPAHNHNDLYPQLATVYSNPVWVGSLAWSKISNPPTTISGYGITDAVAGSGTINYVAKFTGSTTLGNSQIHDNGTNVGIGGTAGGHKLRVAGAIRADGDAASVGLYIASGTAIRSESTMFIDAGGPVYFRGNSGASYLMEMNGSTGGIRFNSYYSTSQFQGTAAGLLAFDTSGNMITYEAVRKNAQNDARYTQFGHTHSISEIVGLQAALGDRPTWGDVYTRTQLNTSGGGGLVHWNNVTNKPDLSYNGHIHDDRYYTETEVNSLLGGKADWGHNHDDRYYTEAESDGRYSFAGHGHGIGEISGLQDALNNRPQWGDIYTRSQSDGRYLQSESDPHGISSHFYNVSGSTVTHSIDKRNGQRLAASFDVPTPYISASLYNGGSRMIGVYASYNGTVMGGNTIYLGDDWGVSGISASLDSPYVLRITVSHRNGGNFQATVNLTNPNA